MCNTKTSEPAWKAPNEPDLPREVKESIKRFLASEEPILAPLSLPVDIPVLPRSLPESWADLSLDLEDMDDGAEDLEDLND